jgi:hypothetical protein
MTIKLNHLENLLRCNKNIKIGFIEDTNILEIKNLSTVILKLELSNNSLEDNSKIIYDAITNLEGVTLYIPKIYIP